MTRATTEGTPQIIAINVGMFSQEENPAMTAALQVAPQVGLDSQNRALSLIVLQNKVANLVCAIPVRTKLKMRLDLYCKKPSVSLMMLMVVSMSSFYSIDAFASSGRTGTVLSRTAASSGTAHRCPALTPRQYTHHSRLNFRMQTSRREWIAQFR